MVNSSILIWRMRGRHGTQGHRPEPAGRLPAVAGRPTACRRWPTSLGLSQPAVSNALARLAQADGRPAVPAHAQGHGADARSRSSSPSRRRGRCRSSTRRSTSARPSTRRPPRAPSRSGMTDIGEIYFLPKLMKELARARARRLAQHGAQHHGEPAGRDGGGPCQPGDGPAAATQGRLLPAPACSSKRYVCMFRRGHPLDKRSDLARRLFGRRARRRDLGRHRPWQGGRTL